MLSRRGFATVGSCLVLLGVHLRVTYLGLGLKYLGTLGRRRFFSFYVREEIPLATRTRQIEALSFASLVLCVSPLHSQPTLLFFLLPSVPQ